ncbi:MAG: alpha/beta hydrolase, partial [Planctomycetales bacterium]
MLITSPRRSAPWNRKSCFFPCAWAVCLLGLGVAETSFAQEEKEQEIPPPEVISWVTTADGIELTATYYPGFKGKDAVPILMVHELNGSRRDFQGLALGLQKEGHASLAIDLRGHGDSRKIVGSVKEI